jgi:hypothetical protein
MVCLRGPNQRSAWYGDASRSLYERLEAILPGLFINTRRVAPLAVLASWKLSRTFHFCVRVSHLHVLLRRLPRVRPTSFAAISALGMISHLEGRNGQYTSRALTALITLCFSLAAGLASKSFLWSRGMGTFEPDPGPGY